MTTTARYSDSKPPNFSDALERRIEMPRSSTAQRPTRKMQIGCIAVTATVVVVIAIAIACIADSYHKINEGYVGIYFRHGALRDKVTDPGVHFMVPFVDDYSEVMIRPETHMMDPFAAMLSLRMLLRTHSRKSM